MSENFDKSVSGSSLRKRAGHSPITLIPPMEFPNGHEVDQPYRGTVGAPSMDQQYQSGRARLEESRDEQFDHAAGIVARVVVSTNAEVADAMH